MLIASPPRQHNSTLVWLNHEKFVSYGIFHFSRQRSFVLFSPHFSNLNFVWSVSLRYVELSTSLTSSFSFLCGVSPWSMLNYLLRWPHRLDFVWSVSLKYVELSTSLTSSFSFLCGVSPWGMLNYLLRWPHRLDFVWSVSLRYVELSTSLTSSFRFCVECLPEVCWIIYFADLIV
jgi:hypothetical protein